MNILAYDNSRYLVNLDKDTDNVYIVDIKLKVILGYDNIHKIMRFGVYEAFGNDKLTKKMANRIKKIFKKYNLTI